MSTHKIAIKGFETVEVAEGKKLVKAIEDAGVDISHRCGGNARCTTCRVKFISEEPPMDSTERNCLDEDEVLGEFRLSCQIRVDRDMSVEVLMKASDNDWSPGPDVED